LWTTAAFLALVPAFEKPVDQAVGMFEEGAGVLVELWRSTVRRSHVIGADSPAVPVVILDSHALLAYFLGGPDLAGSRGARECPCRQR